MEKLEKSKGHIQFHVYRDEEEDREWIVEFFRHENTIYRAHISGVIDLNTRYRLGARSFCNVSRWEQVAISSGVLFPKPLPKESEGR